MKHSSPISINPSVTRDKRNPSPESLATYPRDTVFFAACPQIQTGWQALKPSDAAHPSQYCFADELSARNYDRELKGQPFPDGSNPIVLVAGANTTTRNRLITGLIRLRYGARLSPQIDFATSESVTREILRKAAADGNTHNGQPYVWILSERYQSMALAIFAAQNSPIRIYCSYPHASRPPTSPSVSRLSRVIVLSA
jgi:hypothetical protein